MKQHYRVKRLTLTRMSAQVELERGTWLKDDPSGEREVIAGEDFPKQVECDPSDPHAEFFDSGGTGLDLALDPDTSIRPGDFVTITIEIAEHEPA